MEVLVDPDPSQIYWPDGGKNKKDFQNYTSGPLLDRVYATYKLMHTHQTVDFVRKKTGSTFWGCCMIWGRSLLWLGSLNGQLLETPSLLPAAPKNLLSFAIQLFRTILTPKTPDTEYMYQVMKFNKFSLPPKAFYMIRFHSFYPWYTGGDYYHLCSLYDLSILPWVQEFNKFDLYTKSKDLPDVSKLHQYYQGLIDKYCPGVLCR